MRKFVRKSALFLVLVVLVNILLHIAAPYYWGNTSFASKLAYYTHHASEYDAVFFGSSRTHRQVDPVLFSQTLSERGGENITGFNLGAQATFNPQVYYLYDNFLEENDNAIKVAFVELMEVNEIPDEILHTTRNKYWITPSYYWFSLRHFFDFREWDEMWNYTVTFFEDFFNANQVMQILASLKGDFSEDKFLGLKTRGYAPMEAEIRSAPDGPEARDLHIRHKRFLTQGKNLDQRKIQAEKAAAATATSHMHSSVHLDRLLHLIRKSEEKGIKLIFFVADIKSRPVLMSVYQNLPPANRLELVSPKKYPYAYESRYRWDLGHLNEEGSALFTRHFAEEYLKLPK